MKNFKKLFLVFICICTVFVTFGCSSDKSDDTVIDYDSIEAVDETKLADSLKELGYDSLQAYREENHNYLNSIGNDNVTFSEMTGYWYPNDDPNSLFYIAIDELGQVTFYQFNYSEDEVVGTTSIKSSLMDTYTFNNGQKCSIKNYALVFEDYTTTFTRYDY